jgi:isoleucyl-tRNA synthetase
MAIRVQHEMDQYNIHHAFNIIYEHCVKELSAFYIEIVKDRHYTCKKDSKPYISLQITADAILQILLRVLAPFIPFTIQEVLLHCQQDHILKLSWEDVIRLPEEDKLISDSIWNIIKELISESNIMFAALQSSISDIRKDECLLILECTHELKRVLIPISHQDQLHIIFGCAKVMCVTSQNNRVQNYIPLKTTKCPRCWNRFLSLNKNSICFRCQGDLNSEQSSFVPVRIYV